MEAKTPHSIRGFAVRFVGALVGLILLYVLGIGPAAVFERRILFISSGRDAGDAFILKLYKPLWETSIWLGVRVPPLRLLPLVVQIPALPRSAD